MITTLSLTNSTLTVIIDNGAQIIPVRNDNPKWSELFELYKQFDVTPDGKLIGPEDKFLSLLSLKSIVEEYTVGFLSVNATGVTYRGNPIHTVDAERVMAFLRDGLPYKPIANYIERKAKNPSARAIQEMYGFLEHKGMPLTPKGTFLAYKGVQSNFYSIHGNKDTVVLQGTVNEEGQILNEVGAVIEVERSSVDDNFLRGCSFGLHVGSLAYARGWGQRVMLVEIDPADVVSVPQDGSCQKLRCCKYTVIGEYTGPMPDTYTDEFESEEPETCNCDECECSGECDGECEHGCLPEPEDRSLMSATKDINPPTKASPSNSDLNLCPICGIEEFGCACAAEAERQELQTQITNEALSDQATVAHEETITDVQKRVISVFAEQLGYKETDIKFTQTGVDLGMDSLDGVEVCMSLEEEFNFEISDEVAEKYEHSTIGEICKGISDYLARINPAAAPQDSYTYGYGVGRADSRNGTSSVFTSGDELAADSDRHRDYIVGYLRGYAEQ